MEWIEIVGIQESFIDYPEHLSLMFFVKECPWNCIDCQNKVNLKDLDPMPMEDVFDYINVSKNLINHFVISGGEPTYYPGLIDFIKEIRRIVPSAKIKLDTNGINPYFFTLIESMKNIDAVSMDIKTIVTDTYAYRKICRCYVNIHKIISTIELLNFWSKQGIKVEFRTTLVDKSINLQSVYNSLKDVLGEDLNNIPYTINSSIIRKV